MQAAGGEDGELDAFVGCARVIGWVGQWPVGADGGCRKDGAELCGCVADGDDDVDVQVGELVPAFGVLVAEVDVHEAHGVDG